MGTNEWEGTTKHTKHTKEKFRTTNGHEWTRMGNPEPRMDTNGHEWVGGSHETHEWHERKIQNHEWTRMDTNRWVGTTKHTKYTKGKSRGLRSTE